ncbi:ubiquitin carboxyl-terminal hydrolase 8-like [Mercurialis annua]|uniref:ubiquitin carboxyl-terminal hydrolase 8-like n=1 Tax=Mercurialis annua TaxID=3986 RepID=UPI0021604708|nr:ubiquitin carboxyl-terminal hydrolase 8-like [Mercurialis annua]
MRRRRVFSVKLFIFSFIAKSSIKLTHFSLSIFNRFFKSFLFKTLTFFPLMDDHFLTAADDTTFNNNNNTNNTLIDLDLTGSAASTSYPSGRYFSRPFVDDDDNGIEKLYLVPFRWWNAARIGDGETGVLYDVAVSSNSDEDDYYYGRDSNKEIVLELSKVDEGRRESCNVFALLSASMWLRTLKLNYESNDVNTSLLVEDLFEDAFPLQIRLSVSVETNTLIVKIGLNGNEIVYNRACNLFSPKDKLMIWDFSRQITQLLLEDKVDLPNGSIGQPAEEILLELQVHGLSYSIKGRDGKSDEMEINSMEDDFSGTSSIKMNGGSELMSTATPANLSLSGCGYRRVGFFGLTGLRNLGNTCFMNSVIQCLAHTSKLVDYFLGDYKKEINRENPLGLNGELALAFEVLLRKLWTPGAVPVAPRMFKLKVTNFAPQFSGYNQHDSQEFLVFLLDGLHEDLNRVKSKKYIEAKDTDDRPDNEVADEYWQNHLARNDSSIVDLYQGQYRSTLICHMCKKKSVTFDPFMHLSLPLPSTTMRSMTLTLLSTDGATLPSPITVTVLKCGLLKDLLDALSSACSLGNDETLLVAEIYRNKIFRILMEPSDALDLIRDDDKLVAYRLPKDNEASTLVVFMHEYLDKTSELTCRTPNWKLFGIPFVTRLSNLHTGLDLRRQYLKLVNPFIMPPDDDVLNDYDDSHIATNDDSQIATNDDSQIATNDDSQIATNDDSQIATNDDSQIATNDDSQIATNEDSAMEDVPSPTVSNDIAGTDGETDDDSDFSDFQFCCENMLGSREGIQMSNPISFSRFKKTINVHVSWSEKMIEKYDTCILRSLPEVFKPQLYTRRPYDSVSLYKCLEAFLTEEPLGQEDMWYCPACKKHQQATKKLDLWRLPEILVVHLKRFSYSRFSKNKLETHVDFPVRDFHLSNYISREEDGQVSYRYVLYAIINHYGCMGGGHYTAFIDHGQGRWYEFDDDSVIPVNEDRIKTSAAYVLFYRRVA